MQVSLSRPKVALGSPVEVTYKFTVAPDAPNLGQRRVFVHFLDADEELMWTDDHDPPTPTSEWKPGQTVEYTRTMFIPSYPYVGAAKIAAGMYTPGNNERLKFSNEDRGDRSYKVADFELLPQTENIFVIFKDGWHPAEVVTEGAGRTEWQWTKKEATIAFRNPKRDVVARAAGRQSRRRSKLRAAGHRPNRRSGADHDSAVRDDVAGVEVPGHGRAARHRRHGGDEVHRR